MNCLDTEEAPSDIKGDALALHHSAGENKTSEEPQGESRVAVQAHAQLGRTVATSGGSLWNSIMHWSGSLSVCWGIIVLFLFRFVFG